jgi:hypothetical protein
MFILLYHLLNMQQLYQLLLLQVHLEQLYLQQ